MAKALGDGGAPAATSPAPERSGAWRLGRSRQRDRLLVFRVARRPASGCFQNRLRSTRWWNELEQHVEEEPSGFVSTVAVLGVSAPIEQQIQLSSG